MDQVIGVFAHVDAGKTTFCEQLLYHTAAIRRRGRVDDQDSFMDHHEIERSRGISIFVSEAQFSVGAHTYSLIDTPGHTDFYGETERALGIADYALLIISGTEGVQNNTRLLFSMFEKYNTPVFLFVNKMDAAPYTRAELLSQLQNGLSEAVVDMNGQTEEIAEALASLDDTLADAFLQDDLCPDLWLPRVQQMVRERSCFPCCFGSALADEGIDRLISVLDTLTHSQPPADQSFRAKIFQVSHQKGKRFYHAKVLSGQVRAKDSIPCLGPDGSIVSQKINELFHIQGARPQPAAQAGPGQLFAFTGPDLPRSGDIIGSCPQAGHMLTRSVFLSRIQPVKETPLPKLAAFLAELEAEEPLLRIERTADSLYLHFNGPIQLEVLSRLMETRFNCPVTFGDPDIVYAETLAAPVRGCGHFEPLRHYAEVHLLIEPGPRGSGITYESRVSTDDLPSNWQHLIRTHVFETSHPGVLTGAAATDLHISLLAARGHLKHTEGGDFREATYRAIRQGLASGRSVLLEPVYAFSLSASSELLGKVLFDLQQLHAEFSPPEVLGELFRIEGTAPAACFFSYPLQFRALSKGQGMLSSAFSHYAPCHNAAEVIAQKGYDFTRDTARPADSVFCSHGAGYPVRWDQAPAHMHCELDS